MKQIILALAALSLLSTVIPAKAGNCTTRCTPTYSGGSTCNTMCW